MTGGNTLQGDANRNWCYRASRGSLTFRAVESLVGSVSFRRLLPDALS